MKTVIIYLKPEHFEPSLCEILTTHGDADLMQDGLGDEFEAVFAYETNGKWNYDDYEVAELYWQFKSVGCLRGELSEKGKEFAQEEVPYQLGVSKDVFVSEGDLA